MPEVISCYGLHIWLGQYSSKFEVRNMTVGNMPFLLIREFDSLQYESCQYDRQQYESRKRHRKVAPKSGSIFDSEIRDSFKLNSDTRFVLAHLLPR
jgi:hypothetical protein